MAGSDPVTSTFLCRRLLPPSVRARYGVCDSTTLSAGTSTPSFLLTSAAFSRSSSPPPLVRSVKGMLFSLRKVSVSAAPGIGLDDRRRTPSMLGTSR